MFLFTLEGVGYGTWETEGNAVEMATADLFVMIHWVNARRGAYNIQIDIRDTSGKPIMAPVYNETIEIPNPHHIRQWNVPLTGLIIPTGFHYLWVSVEGVLKAPIVLRVFGSDEPRSD